MWTRMFSGFFEHLAWSALLWIVLLGLFGYFFARERFRLFINGLGLLVASIVTGPITFLRKSVGVVAGYDPAMEEELRASDQYLLNKLLLGLRAGVILVAIGSLAAGLVTTWNIFLPDKVLRDASRETRERIREYEGGLAEVDKNLNGLDAAWARDREGVMAKFRQEVEGRKRAADKDKKALEKRAEGTYAGELLTLMKNDLASQNPGTREALDEAKSRLDNIAQYSWGWYIQQADRTLAAQWSNAWYAGVVATWELANVSEDEIRLRSQGDLGRQREAKANLEQSLTADRSNLEALRAQAKYHPGKALLSLIGTVSWFLFLVWLLGTGLELLSLSVHLAGDVRKLRLATDQPQEEVKQVA